MKFLGYEPVFLASWKEHTQSSVMADAMAGIIVGIVALPLAIAFAIASGVSPEKGIITAVLAGLIISVFGGSRVQIGGPTGAFIIIVYGIIEQYGFDGLMVATIMAGAFLVLLGFLKLGTIIEYIPYPITVGFTAGIALTIFTTQVKDLLGLTIANMPSNFIDKWVVYAHSLNSINWWSAAVGLLSIVIITNTKRFSKKIPGSLVAIVVMTVGAWALQRYAGVDTIETIGDRFVITAKLPELSLPHIDFATLRGLMAPAFTIALLGAIESLLSATVADGVSGDHHDSNAELIGQGMANMLVPLFGGIPATGAIARTMTNINNGGSSPIAGIVHAIMLLLIFLFMMPLAQYIPMSCLAGVLVVAYNMSGWRTCAALLKTPKSDIAVLVITFLLTVIFDLTIAIQVGLLMACLLLMRRVAEITGVSLITDKINLRDETDVLLDRKYLEIPDEVEVYEIYGPYFFGMGNKFEELMANLGEKAKVRIIRMRKVPFIDSTGLHNLAAMIKQSEKEGIQVVLSGVLPSVEQVLLKANFDQRLGRENICSHINLALERAKQIVEASKK